MSLQKGGKQSQPQYLPSRPNNYAQQERDNIPEYPYGVPAHITGTGNVTGVGGSSQAPPRHPNSGPAPHFPPNANQQLQPTVGGMHQGPPPGAYVQSPHSGHMDFPKATPPLPAHLHHSINQAGLAGPTPQMAHPNQAQMGARGPQNAAPYFASRANTIRPMNPHTPRPGQIAGPQMNPNPGTQAPLPYGSQPYYVIMDNYGANGQVIPLVQHGGHTGFFQPQGSLTQPQYTQPRAAAPQQQYFTQPMRPQYPAYTGMPPTQVYYSAAPQQGTVPAAPVAPAVDSASKKRRNAIKIINPDTMEEVDLAAAAAAAPGTAASPAPAAEKTVQQPPPELAVQPKVEEPVVADIAETQQPPSIPQPSETETATAPAPAPTPVRENGDISNSSDAVPSPATPSPVPTPTSPDAGSEWRGSQKSKPGRKISRGTPPATRGEVPSVAEESTPETLSTESVNQEQQPAVSSSANAETAAPVASEPKEATEAVPPPSPAAQTPSETTVSNGGVKSEETYSPASTSEMESTPTSTAGDESESAATPKLRHVYKEDQWSPANPEGKKIYDRDFLLKLQEEPASMKKPEGLPNLEVVRDRAAIKKTNDFTPPFMKQQLVTSQPKGLTKRLSQQGRGGDQGMGGQQRPREIKLSAISLNEKARLPEPENAWKPKHALKTKDDDPEKAKTEELFKTVRGILNKLTPSKFDKLTAKLEALGMDTEERLAGVIKIFFEKAVDEPIFSSTYAKMCHKLAAKEAPSEANPQEKTTFRKLLLTRCQKEFEKDKAQLQDVETKREQIEKAESDEKKKELEEELEELVSKNRRRSLGNIRFIGELFKLRILSAKIMFTCVTRLLSQPDDEESLECLCRLLSTIGRELDVVAQQSRPNQMDKCFGSLDEIVRSRKISNRIRFMIQDVVDLRSNSWKPRREDNNPKTIDQIHKEVEKEREEQEKELANMPLFPGPGGSMGGNRDRQGDRRDDRDRKRSRGGLGQSDDGWNTVSSGGRKVDLSQIKIPTASFQLDSSQGSQLKLGPGGRSFQSWGKGASGGGSQGPRPGAPAPSPGDSPAGNRFMLLDSEAAQGGYEHPKPPFAGRSSLGGGAPPRHQEYRGVAGPTKSAMLPPKELERERALEAVRSQNTGFQGRSRSQQSSRESSVSRTDMPPPAAPREPVVKESLLRGDPKLSDDLIGKKAHALVDEFLSQDNLEDAVKEIKESLHAETVARFINEVVLHVIESNRLNRTKTGGLFRELIKERIFSVDFVVEGLTETLQAAEDFLVDIPKLWDYIAELVAPMFLEGVVPLRLLGSFAKPLNEIGKPDFVAHMVAAVIKELVKTQGEATVSELWSSSNAQLRSILPAGIDEADFVKQHNLDFLSRIAPARSSSCARSPSSSMANELTNFLKKNPTPDPKHVISFLEPWSKEKVDAQFIRALVTVIIESCIDGIESSSKLNKERLKNLTEVLRKYIEAVAEFELQALYAVQALVNSRQHPKGLIQAIFETLYDDSVISEDGFDAWNSSDDPAEREGKAVAQKSLASFLTWLNEAEAESGEED